MAYLLSAEALLPILAGPASDPIVDWKRTVPDNQVFFSALVFGEIQHYLLDLSPEEIERLKEQAELARQRSSAKLRAIKQEKEELSAKHALMKQKQTMELAKLQASHVVVVCGGVIPPQDYDFLSDAGVAAIFGPGTNIIDAARTVLSVTADAAA